MNKNNGAGATPDGEFTNGGPGVARSVLGAAWLNMVQRELIAVVEGAGLVLNGGNFGQLFQAVQSLIGVAVAPLAPLASPLFTGNARGPTRPVDDDSTSLATTAFVMRALNLPRSLAANGYYTLPGGLRIQWGTATSNSDDAQSFAFPSNYSTACYGVWTQERGQDSQERLWVTSVSTSGFVIDRDVGVDGNPQFFWVALGV